MAARHRQALAGIVLIGALLRFSTLGVQSMWFDEVHTLFVIERGLQPLSDAETTPPLYFLLAWDWTELVGTGDKAVRSLSALLGTATIPVAYLAARDLISRPAGLVTAAIVATNPLLVWYSQEARAYALLVFLCMLAFWCFARARQGGRSRWLWGWALASSLAVLTHYFAAFPVAAEALLLLLAKERRQGLRETLLAAGAVLGVGLAILPLAVHQANTAGTSFITLIALETRVVDVARKFISGETKAPGQGLGLAVSLALLAGVVLFALRAERRDIPGALVAAGVGGFTVLAPLALAFAGADFFYVRNALPALIPLVMLPAAGLVATRARPGGVAGAAIVCLASAAIVVAVALSPSHHREDWRLAARSLGPPTSPRAVVVLPNFAGLAFGRYAPYAPLPAEGATVSEVAFVGSETHLAVPRPGVTIAREVERKKHQRLAVRRYRFTNPVQMTPEFLGRTFNLTANVILLQTPAPGLAGAP